MSANLTSERSRYIPLSVKQTLALCVASASPAEQEKFEHFGNILNAWFHHQFLSRADQLNSSYAANADVFTDQLDALVQDANFERVTETDLHAALKEESVFRLRLAVDFSAFEDIVFYRRGPSTHTATIKKWLGLKKQQIEFTNYDLVLVYVRFKDPRAEVTLPSAGRLLKLFKNVPKADLEMLFPNTEVRMRLLDKLLIGVPAFISGVAMVTTKIGATLLLLGGAAGFWLGINAEPVTLDQKALIALITAAMALGGYLWKQYSNFKNRKIRFMKTLTESLYFKSVADNEGVISYLLDHAEQSEAKEALLAYAALRALGPADSDRITAWVEAELNDSCQFDTADALKKLTDLKLIKTDHAASARYEALPIDAAFKLMDERWDNLFSPR